MEHHDESRMRTQPEARFSGLQHVFDLKRVASKLRQESQSGEEGHRQETLYKHGSTTVALFVFGTRTRLPPHRAEGVVTIQVLTGHIQITAQDKSHDLRTGNLLVLAPGVEHDLVSYEESEVLLTVNLQAAQPEGTT